ncbi:hypothetical protein ACFORH_31670 [Amycolatopsis roodepoortensis]
MVNHRSACSIRPASLVSDSPPVIHAASCAIGEAEFGQAALDRAIGGALGDHQPGSDLLAGQATCGAGRRPDRLVAFLSHAPADVEPQAIAADYIMSAGALPSTDSMSERYLLSAGVTRD